jgi:hypothetical protein
VTTDREAIRMGYTCDGCEQQFEGARVVFSTEATDETGIDVVVTKRWTVCPGCADEVFTRIGEPSPWSDEDPRTVVQPGEDATAAHLAGYPPTP